MSNTKFWESREWIVPPGLVDYINRFDGLCDVMILKKQSKKTKPLLINGQTGVGKSMFVDYFIHKFNNAKLNPTIKFINCAAIPNELLESELFGHKKGSFTNATNDKMGIFEFAKDGIVILEEIGEMSKYLQAKLLTAIESRSFSRVGGLEDIPLTAQLIATTNVNLKDLRPDFLYRFNVFTIPPIHERRGDILHYMHSFYPEIVGILTEGVALSLLCYNWPGNAREIERVCDSIRMNIQCARNQNFMNKENFTFTLKKYQKEQYAAVMKLGRGVSDFKFDKARYFSTELVKNKINIKPIENSLRSFSLSFDCFESQFENEKYSKIYLGDVVKFNESIDNIKRAVNVQFGFAASGLAMFCSLFYQDLLSENDILDLTKTIKHDNSEKIIASKPSIRDIFKSVLGEKKLGSINKSIDFLSFADIKTESLVDSFSTNDEEIQHAMIEGLKFMTRISSISPNDVTNIHDLYARHRDNKFLSEYFDEEVQGNSEEVSIVEISLDDLRILYYETVCNAIGVRHGFQKELAAIAKRTPGRITQELEKYGLKEKFSELNFQPRKRLVILK